MLSAPERTSSDGEKVAVAVGIALLHVDHAMPIIASFITP
jgi:hypothetical protein